MSWTFAAEPTIAPTALRFSPADGVPREYTAVLTGLPKSGTSMVAAVCDALGLYLGDRRGRLLEGGAFEAGELQDPWNLRRCREAIKEANEDWPRWGLKNPHGHATITELMRLVRAPRIVAVVRDPLAVAERWRTWKPEDWGDDPFNAITRVEADQRQLMELVRREACPALLISYERAKCWPEVLIRSLAAFLDLDPSPHQWCEAIARISTRGGYLKANDR